MVHFITEIRPQLEENGYQAPHYLLEFWGRGFDRILAAFQQYRSAQWAQNSSTNRYSQEDELIHAGSCLLILESVENGNLISEPHGMYMSQLEEFKTRLKLQILMIIVV